MNGFGSMAAMTRNEPFHERADQRIFPYFFGIFLFFGSILAGAIGMLYNLESREYLERLEIEETVNINLEREMILTRLGAVVSDLRFLSRQNELRYLVDGNTDDELVRALVADEYLAFSRTKRIYDQIRFIDASGMEVVRVNFNGGSPAAAAPRDLQRKAGRYYFKDTLRLGREEVFMSPFDLNIEQGKIEVPFKPMIRFGIPIFDRGNTKQGIVVLNYLGEELLEAIRASASRGKGRAMLVNSDGYWLCSPDPEAEWGFMIPDREDRTFTARYPEAWQAISAADRCQVYTPAGLFTAATIYPLAEGSVSSSGAADARSPSGRRLEHDAYYWKIISHVPKAGVDSGTRGLMMKLSLLAVALFLLASVPSWLIAQAIVRRRLHQVALYRSAHFDRLTGLPNRALFMDRLGQAIKDARRYGRSFALMFIDLDGFKEVNDTLGHNAGDRVLVQAAARLLNALRESDTVARMGGDEFTVILPGVDSPVNAHQVAKKIITVLGAPFEIPGHAPRIGASIGISFFPKDGEALDTLLKKADDAMYEAKRSGKNDYRFFRRAF